MDYTFSHRNLRSKFSTSSYCIHYHLIETKASNDSINEINNKLDDLANKFIDPSNIKEYVFVNGQQFEADEAYIKIYKQAKYNIIVIDDYISIKTLSHLRHKNDNVVVLMFSDNKGSKNNKLHKAEYDDLNNEYPSLLIIKNDNKVHDRYIITDYNTDNEKVYVSGASSKDAGKKICTIVELNNTEIIHLIINQLVLNEDLELK